MAAQVQSAETVNDIVEKPATTLTTLRSTDGHLKAGILTVNQRVDLLQEQVDDLVTLTSIGCIHSFSSLCHLQDGQQFHGEQQPELAAECLPSGKLESTVREPDRHPDTTDYCRECYTPEPAHG